MQQNLWQEHLINAMKRIIVAIVLFVGTAVFWGAAGQAPKMALRIGVGGASGLRNAGVFPESESVLSLKGIYGPRYEDPDYTPVGNFGVDYKLGRRVEFSLDFSWGMCSVSALDGVTRELLGVCDAQAIGIVPGLRFLWQDREDRVNALYSRIGLGADAMLVSDIESTCFDLHMAYEVVPIGIRLQFAEKVPLFAYGELVFGSCVNGARLGFGYAF